MKPSLKKIAAVALLSFAAVGGLIQSIHTVEQWFTLESIELPVYSASGDVQKVYASAVAITVTSLHGIATGTGFTAGWMSAAVDPAGAPDDCSITGQIKVGTPTVTAGQIRMYLVPMLDDSTWPGNITGSEGTVIFFADTEIRDSAIRLAASADNDTGASDIYYLTAPSVKSIMGGNMPEKFVLLAAQSTGTALAAGTSALNYKCSYFNVAP